MDLVRSWLGQALRATGAAVVVPVAILVALSLTAIGGSGLGGLGGLGQVLSGPRSAGSDLTVDDSDAEIGHAVTQLAASSAPGVTGTPVPGTRVPGTGGGDDAPGGTAPLPGGGGGGGNGGGGDIDPIPPGGGGGGGGGPAPPVPPSPGEPGVVENVGQTVKDVTGGTPVGPTVEDAVDGLVEVCGRLGCP